MEFRDSKNNDAETEIDKLKLFPQTITNSRDNAFAAYQEAYANASMKAPAGAVPCILAATPGDKSNLISDHTHLTQSTHVLAYD